MQTGAVFHSPCFFGLTYREKQSIMDRYHFYTDQLFNVAEMNEGGTER